MLKRSSGKSELVKKYIAGEESLMAQVMPSLEANPVSIEEKEALVYIALIIS
jgi:hypothetical protein